MEGLQVFVEMRRVVLRCYLIDARGAIFPRPAISFSQPLHVHEVRQRTEGVVWMAARLLCNLLKLC
jgi:hypothetical protein